MDPQVAGHTPVENQDRVAVHCSTHQVSVLIESPWLLA